MIITIDMKKSFDHLTKCNNHPWFLESQQTRHRKEHVQSAKDIKKKKKTNKSNKNKVIPPNVKRLNVKVKVKSLSRVQLFATPWTATHQAPPSMGFSRQECWNGLPFPSPGDLPNPGMEPGPPILQADALLSKPPGKPQKTEYFPPNVGNNTMTSALLSAHTLSYDTRSPSHCNQTRKSK